MILAPEDCGCPIVEEGPSLVNSPVCSGNLLFMVLLQSYLWGRCSISTPCKRIESVGETEQEYDFIVVGAGTAGSIVAGRLTENTTYKVLLLEAGGPEPLGVRVPSFYRTFWDNPYVDWQIRTVPADYCLDQEGLGCKWPLGKGMGGTSQLNGMMYHRGHHADYDCDWVEAGAKGWSWDEVKPFMDMSEGNKQIGSLVDGKYHSDSGCMPIQTFAYQPPAVYDLMDAINQTGLPIIKDMNDPNTPDGFVIAQAFNANGQRYTTARAYLPPKSERPNLNVKLHAHVTKVLFRRKKAIGVEYVDENGNTKVVKARKEVILSAGALTSPKILMHSGVGPKETLEPLGIKVIEDLPVGKNLKNHCGATLYFILKKVKNIQYLDWSALTDYLLQNDGPMSSTGITQLTGLLYSSYAKKERKQPDLQFFFNGFYAECSKTGAIGEPAVDCPNAGYNVSANAVYLLPRSVGYMTINSTDPFEQAIYDPNFFSDPVDMEAIKEGLDYLHQIFNSQLLQDQYEVELDPSYTEKCDKVAPAWSDDWKECMIRVNTDPQNHQLGTCAIGKVVDPELRVYNLKALRVCDAGSMPSQPTGNPQGAIMAVAERCAHFIKEAWQ
ncbi:glucose dehydrogenase [FAD, quinone] [Spodoptera frugiperda]|uniref:Glucose dehydrogenase [FAD, quinone] n=1 Tax=Spodoptera frugiperda TaxID=7108 RepID=A0A9R0DSX7_SPOFR|nr:glucose dehydrogenase [FAD, quinone] [Spodoptera frugiperda]XP_050552653.1 glucose dehydrogenase [FAD, quinone] [Spodoptera frugiperda]XP_050552654.1 glucose dehydrogenase [FAD, quinone] [Spodoptera frugiperda]